MKRLANIIITVILAAIIYDVIAMWWQMAEVKMYGWSQVSIIDSMAAWTIALGAANALWGGIKG